MNIPTAAPDHEGHDLDFQPCGHPPSGRMPESAAPGSRAWIIVLAGLAGMLFVTGGLLSAPGTGGEVCLLEQILERIAPTLVFDNPLV